MNFGGLILQFFVVGVLAMLPAFVALFASDASVSTIVILAVTTISFVYLISSFLTHRWSSSLQRLSRATERLAQGDLSTKVYPSRIPELAGVADGLNSMVALLNARVDALTKLSAEQEAILGGMTEGVLSITRDGRIVRINGAARTLLDVSVADCSGRLVAEVVRHLSLQQFTSTALASQESLSEAISIHGTIERNLHVYSSRLTGDGGDLGILVVLQDTTQLERLERIRRDFVANVSHELRTPITSIKGYLETLLDGAKNDPATLEKFLRVMERQVERLQSIFSDLLTLSQLEAKGDAARADVVLTDARSIVQSALDSLQQKVDQKKAEVTIRAPENVALFANARLMQQAISNLIDNAITYSGETPRVTLEVSAHATDVCFSVSDNGPGIPKIHLPRIFERFYRIDTGRSRDMGGTGLGLAIVKHIAQVHGGTVSVQSTLGIGTIFSLSIPQQEKQNVS